MKEGETFLGPVNTAIRFGIVGLAFLTPLFFLPITSEFYQFNKQVLVVGAAAILLILWGVKVGIEGKMRITRTSVDIAIILFGIAFVLAAVFSVDRYISIAGFYPRFHGSLVSALSYIVLFFVAVSNLDKQAREWVMWALVGSGVVLAVLSVANFFGYSLVQTDYGKIRSWTPIGNSANLSLYLALVLPLALGVFAAAKNRTVQIVFVVAAIIISLPIILFKLTGPILAALAGLAIASIFLSRSKLDRNTRGLLGVFLVIVALFAFVNFVPGLRDSLLKPLVAGEAKEFNIQADKTLPLSSAWKISSQSVGQRPFLGVGPGTFAYSYTAFKGQELNSDDFWNLRFDLAGSEYLTILSSIGIVGLIAFILVLGLAGRSLLTFNYRSEIVKENPTAVFLLGSFTSFLVGIFFQDTTASIWVFFVLLLALIFAYFRDSGVRGIEEVDVKFVALTSGGVQFVEPSDRSSRDSTIGTVITIA